MSDEKSFPSDKQMVDSFVEKSGEGTWRGPFWGTGELGGSYQLGSLEDGWQRNLTRGGCFDPRAVPAVYACVMANSRAISQCYSQHRRIDDKGKHEIMTTTAAANILRRPNPYETWPQFLTNMTAEMQFNGESFAVVSRDERGAVGSLHKCPSQSASPYIDPDSGAVFYSIGSNPMTPGKQQYMVPARDVLHLRQYCPRHALVGESPIAAAAMATGVNVALSQSQAAFFSRMSRPSGVLSTDAVLTADQMNTLREAWKIQSAGMQQGGIPILGGGMKFSQMSITAQDAQLVEAQKYSTADIARVFGVPLPVIGELEHSTLSNVEQMISLWLSVSLGAMLENIEQSFNRLFNFAPNEYVLLDTTSLLRTDFEGRVNGLVKSVQGALMTPNEARAREGLHPVEHGENLFAQLQMQPLGTPIDGGQAEDTGNTPPPPTDVDPEDAKMLLKSVIH